MGHTTSVPPRRTCAGLGLAAPLASAAFANIELSGLLIAAGAAAAWGLASSAASASLRSLAGGGLAATSSAMVSTVLPRPIESARMPPRVARVAD